MCRYYNRRVDLGELLLCAGAGLLSGGVPDVLEPALHPHHRQLAHSVTVGGLLAKFGVERCSFKNGEWDQFHKILAAALIAGYISHLVADGCTPRGLPLLGTGKLSWFVTSPADRTTMYRLKGEPPCTPASLSARSIQRLDKFRNTLSGEVRQLLRNAQGFVDVLETLDTSTGDFVCVWLWNSKESA
jgi:hypothetical protein